MPNPFHYRARIDPASGDARADWHNPGYIRLKALNAIVREMFAPTERCPALNASAQGTYLAAADTPTTSPATPSSATSTTAPTSRSPRDTPKEHIFRYHGLQRRPQCPTPSTSCQN